MNVVAEFEHAAGERHLADLLGMIERNRHGSERR
jgi:hypothetical protein